jgi:CHAD domain-containing protein
MATSPQLTPALLDSPAQESVRTVALDLLRAVSTELATLDANPDAGFHDLRVALRRLRSWLRAYRPELDDTVRKKSRRRLRELAAATNTARDIESMRDWLSGLGAVASRERAGIRWFTGRLETDYAKATTDARKAMNGRVSKLVATLSKQLDRYWLRRDVADPSAPPTMADVTRDALASQADRFERAVDRVTSADDASRIHRLRIATKRLRYLVETIPAQRAQSIADDLRKLQDLLGASHDMHTTIERVTRELGELGARDARIAARRIVHPDDRGADDERPRLGALRPGLNALLTRARGEERRTYDAFRNEWPDDRVAAVVAGIGEVGDSLASRTISAG